MLARSLIAAAFAVSLFSQSLDEGYLALREGRLDSALQHFEAALAKGPQPIPARIDFAYLLLRTGDTLRAREEFRGILDLEPERERLWLEYAFLCFETNQRPQAYEIFLRLRRAFDPEVKKTAEDTFQRLDAELEIAITRWRDATQSNAGSYSGHEELARLLEERNDWIAAAEQYRLAFGLKPDKRKFLLDIARTEREALRIDYSMAALVAASRGPQPYVAELAREQMTTRYPYVYEFEYAIQMDPLNVPLRRELGFLLLAMKREADAMRVFSELLRLAPDDPLANAQLAFLKSARNDSSGAKPLLERAARQSESGLTAIRDLAEKSLAQGYLKDALRYLQQLRENNPEDFPTMLRLGWTHNLLKNDQEAIRWFELARRSPDPKIAAEADRAYRNLRPALAPFRTTTWVLPFYSSRWREVFAYGQMKTEIRLPFTQLRPYLSTRFIGDLGRNRTLRAGPAGELAPQALSESAVVGAIGLASPRWQGVMAWGEAGSAWQYFARRNGTARIKPDYRAGLNFSRSFGPSSLWTTNVDAVFLSRFDNNTLFYWQNRLGRTSSERPFQFYWNLNLTADARRMEWANFFETGPGLRFRLSSMPPGLYFSVDALQGWHLMKTSPGRSQRFRDIRAGLWYAFTR